VGVIRGDQRSVYGYGWASDAQAEHPNGDTVFEIGSITKVFTTSLLAILTADGVLDLSDPVRDLMPSLANLPAEITLLRLATHTAGLPKMPANLLGSMLRNPRNPYAAYSTADLFRYLAHYKPRKRRRDADQIQYSNLGVALLGQILAEASESPYEAALVDRICDELAMRDTRLLLTPEQEARLAPPHSASGKPIQAWDVGAFAGAAALRSTANDMLAFLAANLGRSRSPLTEALQLCHQVRSEAFPRQGGVRRLVAGAFERGREIWDYSQGMALGWFVGSLGPAGEQVWWHHGATGGYRAFAGFMKGTEAGVVVLANRSPGRSELITGMTSADKVGFRVLEVLR
jgi:CubicO group peptidase (beta-lactamase class C family)